MRKELLKEIESYTDTMAFKEIKNNNYTEEKLKEILEVLKMFDSEEEE